VSSFAKELIMTSIAGVGSSSSSDLLTMLQQLARKRLEGTSGIASTSSQQPDQSRQAELESKFEDALVAAGLDSSKLDEVKSAIKSAVSSALSSADGTTDPRELVGKAIAQTLQGYGVDMDKLKDQMKPQLGSMRPPGPPPGGQGAGGMKGFDSKLTDALTAAGVDSSKLEEVKSEINSAISSLIEDSDGNGDPEAIKEAVHKTLDKYGVDKDAFDKEMESGMGSAPPGPRPGGQGVGGAEGQSGSKTLIDYLGSSNGSSDSYQWLAGLFPILDEQA
jgi:hypothetical protein